MFECLFGRYHVGIRPRGACPIPRLLRKSVSRGREGSREDRVPRICHEAGPALMLLGLQGLKSQKIQCILRTDTLERIRSSRGDMQHSIDDPYVGIVFGFEHFLPNLRISSLGHCRRTVERTSGDHWHPDNSNSRRLPLIAFQNIGLSSNSSAERLNEKT